MSARHDVIWLDAEDVLAETERAIQVENARGERVWLPRSQIDETSDGRISVPRWLAEDRELDA